MQKNYVALIASSEVSLREMHALATELLRQNIVPKIVPFGPDASTLLQIVDVALRPYTASWTTSKNDLRNATAIVVSDEIRFPAHISQTYGIQHGPIPHDYGRKIASSVKTFFCLSDDDYNFIVRDDNQSDKCKYVIAGCPSTDKLHRQKENGVDPLTLKELRLRGYDQNKTTVLLTSHWSEVGLFHLYGSSIVKTLSNIASHTNVIISGHPKIFDTSAKFRTFDSVRVSNLLAEAKRSGFIVWRGDTTKILSLANIVIGDRSSIMAQSAIFGADIICDRRYAIPAPITNSLFKEMSYAFNDLSSLASGVNFALTHPNNRMRATERFVTHAFPNLGKSCSIIASHIASNIKKSLWF